jgi:Histidine kinase-, DNA gyrase B-, and HSP90-like ATPase.
MAEPQFIDFRLPLDLIVEGGGRGVVAASKGFNITVPDAYDDDMTEDVARSEVLAIQRLLTISRRAPIRVMWAKNIASRVLASPTIFPLLAVLIVLENASHEIEGVDDAHVVDALETARRKLFKERLKTDFFADTQVVICADSRGRGNPPDLYRADGRMIAREDFEAIIEELVTRQVAVNASTSSAVHWSSALATIVSELFENADTHGKSELSGLPIKENGIRGLVLKRTKVERAKVKDNAPVPPPIEAFELSIFDSGPGFYASYMGVPLEQGVDLDLEWKVIHACLERHYEPGLTDIRQGHRGMGLYEVLRALQLLHGAIEVRTGRIHGYRTFMEGEFKFKMEPASSPTRPGMPKPQLLDVERKYVAVPSKHELLVGSSVRVIVPLH